MKSLVKTLDILETFLHGPDELSVTEVSRALGLNKATVSRIMLKLAGRGYLRQNDRRGKYSLGAVFLEYSGIIKKRLKIRDIAMPYLFALSGKVRESTMLAVWNRRDTASVITETFHDAACLDSPLRVVPDEGITMPLYCTCMGKALLAGLPENELQAYFQRVKLERYAPGTVTEERAIREELARIRCEGVAFDDEEYAMGVRGVTAALVNGEGDTSGSIGVIAPSARLSLPALRELAPLVKSCADNISRQMGYHGRRNSL